MVGGGGKKRAATWMKGAVHETHVKMEKKGRRGNWTGIFTLRKDNPS